jgi:alpha-glucosidase
MIKAVGLGTGGAHLPQPDWFGAFSVEAQKQDQASTLSMYRQALNWRHKLQAAESMDWMPGTGGQVLHFTRPGGWRSMTNFGPGPVPLPHGIVIVSSAPVGGNQLPADTTVWILNGS